MLRKLKQCPVCLEISTGGRMCALCGKSYDQYAFWADSSVMGAIIWAAKRARRFERSRRSKK